MPPWKATFEGLLYISMVPKASFTIGSPGDEHVYGAHSATTDGYQSNIFIYDVIFYFQIEKAPDMDVHMNMKRVKYFKTIITCWEVR